MTNTDRTIFALLAMLVINTAISCYSFVQVQGHLGRINLMAECSQILIPKLINGQPVLFSQCVQVSPAQPQKKTEGAKKPLET